MNLLITLFKGYLLRKWLVLSIQFSVATLLVLGLFYKGCKDKNTRYMVLILDGNSEIAHAEEQSLLFDLCMTFDQIESSHKSNYFLRKDLFSVMHAQHILSYHLIQVSLSY